MKLLEIIKEIENEYPTFIQYEWDNSGLNIGCLENEIKKIMTTLEITKDTVEEAIENEVDLIISHHPFLFSKTNKIVDSNNKGELAIKLIKNDIAVYCMHTSFDVAHNGLNDYFFELIGVKNTKILDVVGSDSRYRDGEIYGLGRVGILDQKINIVDFIYSIKNKLHIDCARFIGDKSSEISSFAVVTGSGAEYFEMIKEKNIDLLITGDMNYHQAVDALELGVNVLDLGHFGTEYIFAEVMKRYLDSKKFVKDVIVSRRMIDPFIIY